MKNTNSLNFDLKQEQTQKLSFEQQQSLTILQTVREELRPLLLELALGNPFMLVEDTRDMMSISGVDFDERILESENPNDWLTSPMSTFHNEEDSHQIMINQLPDASQESFRSFVLNQIMSYRKTPIRDLMVKLVDELDEQGFLRNSLMELELKFECDPIELLDAITLLQQLDPIGIGAQDLREYWMIQTENDSESPHIAYIVLESHFEQLVEREYRAIAKALQVTLSDVEKVVAYYQTFATTPLSQFHNEEIEYIEPDVFIHPTEAGYEVTYNFTNLPKLSFDSAYYRELQEVENKELQEYIKAKKQEVEAIIHSLKSRELTLLQVSQAIVDEQKLFFESKGHRLAPLTLSQIAEKCGYHPSTISRTIQDKHFYTDFGLFEFKDLFSSLSIQSNTGELVSQQQIQQLIQDLVDQEDKLQPLSDQKMTNILNQQGFPLARRTISKYRQQLNIPSARQRRIK